MKDFGSISSSFDVNAASVYELLDFDPRKQLDRIWLIAVNNAISLTLLVFALVSAGCSAGSPDLALSDRVEAAAQDLRWTKGTESRVTVPLTRFRRPVLILALPPGRFSAEDLDPLLHEPAAKQWLRQSMREQSVDASQPTIHVSQQGRAQSSLYYHQILISRPIALWKADDGPLEVSLRRDKDVVEIVGLR